MCVYRLDAVATVLTPTFTQPGPCTRTCTWPATPRLTRSFWRMAELLPCAVCKLLSRGPSKSPGPSPSPEKIPPADRLNYSPTKPLDPTVGFFDPGPPTVSGLINMANEENRILAKRSSRRRSRLSSLVVLCRRL